MADTTYQIADGHDNEAGLTDLDPQPRTDSVIQFEQVVNALGGVQITGYGFGSFVYENITYDELDSLLSQFGVSKSTPSNEVTIAMREEDGTTYTNYNATVIYQPPQRARNGYWTLFTVQITWAEEIV